MASVLATRSGMMKATLDDSLPIACRNEGNGALRRQTIVRSSLARISSSAAAQVWPKLSRLLQRLSEATQSRARTGSPSWNLRPSRRRIVQVLPSADTSAPSAICGLTVKLAPVANSVS